MIARLPRWLLVGLALVLVAGIPALADTFNIADGDVAALIDAINTANGNSESDIISLAAGGTYTLSSVDNGSADDANGLPLITSEITVNGHGATIVRSSAQGTPKFRIFEVVGAGTLVLDDVTIANGFADLGGGIYSHGSTVTLSDCTISGNESGLLGGGICNSSSGTLTLTDCTISGNESGVMGGGIESYDSTVTLTDCTISGNTAEHGGGIESDDSTVTLTDCTVSGNTARDDGGGIRGSSDTLTLTDCTISGNTAKYGGGIGSDTSTVTLTDCTVSGNTAEMGGGIFSSNDSTVKLKNTVLANNTVVEDGPDCYGAVDSYGTNLIEDTSECTISDEANPGTDITGQDPLLGPLEDNGGPTWTHALLPGSPAIEAGSCTDIGGSPVSEDQRGVPRPQPGLGACDIGAFEHQYDAGAGITVTPTSGLITTEVGGTATFDVSANTVPMADVTISLSSSDTTEGTVPTPVVLPVGSTDPVTVTVTGVDDAILDGGVSYTILTGDPTSGDGAYADLGSDDVADVEVTNRDDDDETPPTPDPKTWSAVPHTIGPDAIEMTATTATDPSGVEYFFDETSGNPGGSDSGWQDSATHTDTDLVEGTEYCYQVKARDKSVNQNETAFSSAECAIPVCVETPAVFRVDPTGGVFADGTFTATLFESPEADVAEWVSVSEPVEAGDVLELDPASPGAYHLSQTACSPLVAGVVSTQPGVLLGAGSATEERALLALTGIVPVKVTDEGGPIEPGDLLVSSSTPGHAMRWDGVGSPALIGKALEPMPDEKGLILVLLTAH